MNNLNNATTGDAYTPALTLEPGPLDSLTIQVFNQPIAYQLGTGVPAFFDPSSEVILPPGVVATLDRLAGQGITGIRARSATAGKPAVVTISTTPRAG